MSNEKDLHNEPPATTPESEGPAVSSTPGPEQPSASESENFSGETPLPKVPATEEGTEIKDVLDVPEPPENTATAPDAGQPPQPPVPPAPPALIPEGEPDDLPATTSETPPAIPDADAADQPADKPMGLMDHLSELRARLVRACLAVMTGFLACWAVVDPIFNALVDPLLRVLPEGSHAIYTTLPEGFFTRMHISFVAGVFVSSPIIFYQIWSFIAPGLYEEEKRDIIPIAVMSALFFISGGAFCYYVVFPNAFAFFVSYATDSIVAMPKISDYLSLVLKLILAFGLVFEMPLFAFFLARMGIISAALMRKVRRYAILAIFIVAAILSPPDVVSQLLMACPMLVLYEISILVAAAVGRRDKKKNGEAKQPEEKTPGPEEKETKTTAADAAEDGADHSTEEA